MTTRTNKAPLPGSPNVPPRIPGSGRGCRSHEHPTGDRSALLRELGPDLRLKAIVYQRANVPWLAALITLGEMERDGIVELVEDRVRLTDAGIKAQRALVKSDLDDWHEAKATPWEIIVLIITVTAAAVAWIFL